MRESLTKTKALYLDMIKIGSRVVLTNAAFTYSRWILAPLCNRDIGSSLDSGIDNGTDSGIDKINLALHQMP